MYQHNWAALVNTDAAFLLWKEMRKKKSWIIFKSDITTQYLCKENISKKCENTNIKRINIECFGGHFMVVTGTECILLKLIVGYFLLNKCSLHIKDEYVMFV